MTRVSPMLWSGNGGIAAMVLIVMILPPVAVSVALLLGLMSRLWKSKPVSRALYRGAWIFVIAAHVVPMIFGFDFWRVAVFSRQNGTSTFVLFGTIVTLAGLLWMHAARPDRSRDVASR
jgi:hypothetical protein